MLAAAQRQADEGVLASRQTSPSKLVTLQETRDSILCALSAHNHLEAPDDGVIE
jgi:hypothetical protein